MPTATMMSHEEWLLLENSGITSCDVCCFKHKAQRTASYSFCSPMFADANLTCIEMLRKDLNIPVNINVVLRYCYWKEDDPN